mgnify:CR=1 FL=1
MKWSGLPEEVMRHAVGPLPRLQEAPPELSTSASPGGRKQRWNRETYNIYMRNYMRQRRKEEQKL